MGKFMKKEEKHRTEGYFVDSLLERYPLLPGSQQWAYGSTIEKGAQPGRGIANLFHVLYVEDDEKVSIEFKGNCLSKPTYVNAIRNSDGYVGPRAGHGRGVHEDTHRIKNDFENPSTYVLQKLVGDFSPGSDKSVSRLQTSQPSAIPRLSAEDHRLDVLGHDGMPHTSIAAKGIQPIGENANINSQAGPAASYPAGKPSWYETP